VKKAVLVIIIFSILMPNATALLIGGDGNSSFFNGTIDELVIYNRTITLS